MPVTRAAVEIEPGSARATSVALTSVGVVVLLAFGVVTVPAFVAELAQPAREAATTMAGMALRQVRFTAVGRRWACVGSALIAAPEFLWVSGLQRRGAPCVRCGEANRSAHALVRD